MDPILLQSCSHNTLFQWLIFGSSPSITPTPDNVQFVPIDQPALEQLVSETLAVPWKMARGYKLVDLKPAYGHIFSEWLQGYDFWGYTDMDVIYGRLTDFVTPTILQNHDIITAKLQPMRRYWSDISLCCGTRHVCVICTSRPKTGLKCFAVKLRRDSTKKGSRCWSNALRVKANCRSMPRTSPEKTSACG